MAKIDWLILPEKENQAIDVINGVFDKLKGAKSITSEAKRTLKSGGFQRTDESSIFKGTVAVARFQGHLLEMEWPDKQDPKYSNKAPAVKDKFGQVISGGWKTQDEVLGNFPVKLDDRHIAWKYGNSKAKALAMNIKKLWTQSQNIIISTDFDAEGEMIFRNWLNFVMHGKVDWTRLYRVKIGGLDTASIQKAFTQQLYHYSDDGEAMAKLAAAGHARAVSDYEYGLSFATYGRFFEQKINGANKAIGGYGRLKNSIVGYIYEQQQAHDNFKPHSTYRIDLQLPDETLLKGISEANDATSKIGLTDRGLIFETKAAAEAFIKSGKLNSSVTVKRDAKNKASKGELLFDRANLVAQADKEFRGTLNKGQAWKDVLQDLYEKKKIMSYIRTDARYIYQNDFKDMQLVGRLTFVQKLLADLADASAKQHHVTNDFKFDLNAKPNKRWVDDKKAAADAHPAITPTTKDPKLVWSSLTAAEKAVYSRDLAVTMSMFANDSIAETFKYQSTDGLFSDTRSRTKVQGWRLLVDKVTKDDVISDAYSGPATYVITEVKAKQPSLMTVSSMMTFMKRQNWGTSATRDQTLDLLVDKRVLRKQKGNQLVVNQQLMPVIDYLIQHQLINFKLTSQWQNALSQLKNDQDAQQFIDINRKLNVQLNDKVTELLHTK